MEKYQIEIQIKAIIISLNHKNTQTDILENLNPKKQKIFYFYHYFLSICEQRTYTILKLPLRSGWSS
jgi:hypothetical protein